MGSRVNTRKETASHLMTFQVKPSFLEKMREEAQRQDISVGELIRKSVKREIDRAKREPTTKSAEK